MTPTCGLSDKAGPLFLATHGAMSIGVASFGAKSSPGGNGDISASRAISSVIVKSLGFFRRKSDSMSWRLVGMIFSWLRLVVVDGFIPGFGRGNNSVL